MATITTERPRARKLPQDQLRMPDWRAAGWTGIAGGGLFLALELLLLPRTNGIPAGDFVNMVAAIVLGPSALSEPAGGPFYNGVMAMAIHFSISLVYLHLLSIICYRRSLSSSCAIGLGFGIALYLLNFHVFTALFPWFVEARGASSLAANAAFGLFSAWLYKNLERSEPLIGDPSRLSLRP